jgi:hypothetical protein
MKKSKLSFLFLLLITLLIGACSSDSEAPKEKFSANEESFDLKNAKLYITRSGTYSNGNGDFVYRDYMVTDGTYIEGNGWELSHYSDATYFLAFEVLIPVEEDYLPGTYARAYTFSNMSSRSIYFYGETTDASEYYETSNDSDEFKVSGEMEDGEIMTIKYKGELLHSTYDGDSWTETPFTGSIFVSARVEDVRPI